MPNFTPKSRWVSTVWFLSHHTAPLLPCLYPPIPHVCSSPERRGAETIKKASQNREAFLIFHVMINNISATNSEPLQIFRRIYKNSSYRNHLWHGCVLNFWKRLAQSGNKRSFTPIHFSWRLGQSGMTETRLKSGTHPIKELLGTSLNWWYNLDVHPAVEPFPFRFSVPGPGDH